MAKQNSINNESDPLDATNLTINSAYTFPNTDGASNQVLMTDGASTVTWETIGGDGDLTWNQITVDTNAAVKNAYICNATSAITITLPANFAQGDIVKIVGKNTGGWRVRPNTGDTIYYLSDSVGDTSYFSPTNSRGCCEVHGITNDTEWEITEVEDTDFLPAQSSFICASARKGYVQIGYALKGWGLNTGGSLGTGSAAAGDRSSAVNILGPLTGNKFTNLASGPGVYALGIEGTMYAWGVTNSYSQDGGSSPTSPNRVFGTQRYINLGIGGSLNGCAIDSNNDAYTWGSNISGELGDGTTVTKSIPTLVIGSHKFTKVMISNVSGELTSPLGKHGIALKADGSAWCWGANASGELGDGTTTPKSSPISVIGGHSFIDIAAGPNHSLALKADGSAWGWGKNSYGELGTNNITNYTSPVPMVGGHSFIKIIAGGTHVGSTGNYDYSAALKADGSVWTCGRNPNGVLGDGTTVSKSVPTLVVGGHSFIAISAGIGGITGRANHIIALKANNEVWAWGNNTNGQLGDNSTTDRSSPVQVVGV